MRLMPESLSYTLNSSRENLSTRTLKWDTTRRFQPESLQLSFRLIRRDITTAQHACNKDMGAGYTSVSAVPWLGRRVTVVLRHIYTYIKLNDSKASVQNQIKMISCIGP